MRAGDVRGGAGQLHKTAQRLEVVWKETQQFWNDENSRDFEQEELIPLFQAVRTAAEATARFATVVQQAQAACDPDGRKILGD